MSDYVYREVIRLPIPESLVKRLKVTSPYDCEKYFEEKFKDKWGFCEKEKFDIEGTTDRYYLDYVLDYSYGEKMGEYGYSRYLSKEEKEEYKKLFDLGEFEYNVNDLRKVTYCYYNCSEPIDYYEPN